MQYLHYMLFCDTILVAFAFRNTLYTLDHQIVNEAFIAKCQETTKPEKYKNQSLLAKKIKISEHFTKTTIPDNYMFLKFATRVDKDPIIKLERDLHRAIYGPNFDEPVETDSKIKITLPPNPLIQYPSGHALQRGYLFKSKASVCLPRMELMQRGHCRLRITTDFMQTAVNAFAIFQYGDLNDVLALPAEYVLRSARTIAMMKLSREKLMATWDIVKGDKKPEEITITTLELYRPLFKHVPGKEISRLNLSNARILSYIGTHADLDRHQVGLVANKYIRINPDWMKSRYLNLMNNLLCGIPMTFMRKIDKNNYLQLSYQTFYHIRACDPLQRRFFLTMMTNTQTLGKSASWTALDVSRLGYLLVEIEGPLLATVNPPAMAGITAQVMRLMPAVNLKYITEMQLRYLEQKPLNILAKKLMIYHEMKYEISNAYRHIFYQIYLIIYVLIKIINV